MKSILLTFIAIILSGCTTYKTKEQLITNPKTFKYSFEAPLNYQKAYRIIAEMSRYCLQGAAAGNERRTEENLDLKNQTGEIHYINHNAFWGDDYFGYYLIKPIAADKSEVTVYHPTNALGHNDDRKFVEEWLQGSKKCQL